MQCFLCLSVVQNISKLLQFPESVTFVVTNNTSYFYFYLTFLSDVDVLLRFVLCLPSLAASFLFRSSKTSLNCFHSKTGLSVPSNSTALSTKYKLLLPNPRFISNNANACNTLAEQAHVCTSSSPTTRKKFTNTLRVPLMSFVRWRRSARRSVEEARTAWSQCPSIFRFCVVFSITLRSESGQQLM